MVLPRNTTIKLHFVHTQPKNMFASIKKLSKFSKITFLSKENQRKSLTDSLLATMSLPNVKFDILTSPTSLVPKKGFIMHASLEKAITIFVLCLKWTRRSLNSKDKTFYWLQEKKIGKGIKIILKHSSWLLPLRKICSLFFRYLWL
jgi:hypothetical protein